MKPYRTKLINEKMGAERMTNQEVAEAAGVSSPTVSAIRNGNPNITLAALMKVATALKIPLSELFAEEVAELEPAA